MDMRLSLGDAVEREMDEAVPLPFRYALSARLELPRGARKEEIVAALKGKVLGALHGAALGLVSCGHT